MLLKTTFTANGCLSNGDLILWHLLMLMRDQIAINKAMILQLCTEKYRDTEETTQDLK